MRCQHFHQHSSDQFQYRFVKSLYSSLLLHFSELTFTRTKQIMLMLCSPVSLFTSCLSW
jgi:hypothetical protein